MNFEGEEAFGGDLPMTETWFVGKYEERRALSRLNDEVDRMLENLYRDECMHIFAREAFGKDAERKLPSVVGSPAGPDCSTLDCLRCRNVLAEYQALADLKWILIRMHDGDFHEFRDAWKRRIEAMNRAQQGWAPDEYYMSEYIRYSK